MRGRENKEKGKKKGAPQGRVLKEIFRLRLQPSGDCKSPVIEARGRALAFS